MDTIPINPISGVPQTSLKLFTSIKPLDQMYRVLVRSHLDYCDIIYHIPPLGLSLNNLMEKVERIQYQAALTITGAWLGSNLTKLYGELGWESLSNLTKLYEELGWESLSNRSHKTL